MQKRTKKKALLLTLGAVMLVAVSVLSTIAFLKSSDSVNNTFTVGKYPYVCNIQLQSKEK